MKIEIDSEFLKALTNLVKWLVVLTLVMARHNYLGME